MLILMYIITISVVGLLISSLNHATVLSDKTLNRVHRDILISLKFKLLIAMWICMIFFIYVIAAEGLNL